jgi:hypothetical protein
MTSDDKYEPTKDDLDNRSVQLNPTSDAYWQSRGEEERPSDWQDRKDD